ncbi:MAG: cytidine deaminase, partial [Melioribacteraceae bacterium]|nr:cytidine deaminase [Melioribacteraceae bacterium]
MTNQELAQIAVGAKSKSYSPYSNFRVGAALLTEDGEVYEGANIENAAYGLTICAERTAAFSAKLSEENNFRSIAVASDSQDFTPPCGSCRQVLLELCGKDLEVIMINKNNELKIFKLSE